MRSQSRPACAPTPAKPEPMKNCGAWSDFSTTSITKNIPPPTTTPYKGSEILKERGYSEEVRRAILSHAEYTGVARLSPMEKTLFACDELAGFITACALVKPGKSLAEVEAPVGPKKDEGQSLRPQRSPRRHHSQAPPISDWISKSTSPSASKP
jgi:hypothetical protein